MMQQFRENQDEFFFLAGVILFSIWAFAETTTYLPTSRIVPQLMLALINMSSILILVWKAKGEQIKTRLNLEDANSGFDFGDDDPEEQQLAGLYELDLFGVGKELGWILAYVLGIVYIGFFTVSIAFSVSYILVNETSPLRRRIPMSIGWTGIILGILYVLFVQFLQVSSVWRLGFLP